jgi:hypothetical protein
MKRMKIAREDYKHIASLAGMAILVIGYCALDSKAIENQIQKVENQKEYCKSDISSSEFERFNCPEILTQY